MTNDILGSASVELLRRIYNAEGRKLRKADINYDDKLLLQRLEMLLSQELIAPTDDEFISGDAFFGIVYNSYIITAKGIDFLDRLDQSAAEEAKAKRHEEKQRRKDARRSWYQLIIGGFLGIAGVILGAYLEAKSDWLKWIIDLFP